MDIPARSLVPPFPTQPAALGLRGGPGPPAFGTKCFEVTTHPGSFPGAYAPPPERNSQSLLVSGYPIQEKFSIFIDEASVLC